MTLLSKIAMGCGVCCAIVTPLVFPGKVNPITAIGIGLLTCGGVYELGTMTAEKMKRTAMSTVIAGTGIGIMVQCGVKLNPITAIGIGLLSCGGVNYLGTMTVEKMKKAARNMVIVGTGIGIMVQCGVKWDFIVRSAVFTGMSIIVIGLALIPIAFSFLISWGVMMMKYSFSRGISPQGISRNALGLCRLNDEIRETLGGFMEIQYLNINSQWDSMRVPSRVFRVLEFCRILRPSFVYSRIIGINYADSFIIYGSLRKGVVKWLAGARGVGRWKYIYLTVDVEDEDGGFLRTIQVPIPEGVIAEVPIIEAA